MARPFDQDRDDSTGAYGCPFCRSTLTDVRIIGTFPMVHCVGCGLWYDPTTGWLVADADGIDEETG